MLLKKCKLYSQICLHAQVTSCEDTLMGAALQFRHKKRNKRGNKHQRDGKLQYRDSEIYRRLRSR